MTAPEVPHADLIAENERATTTADDWLAAHKVTESWRIVNRLRDQLVRMADALAALGDTVPREQYEVAMTHWRGTERERDEARAERDALAHFRGQVDALLQETSWHDARTSSDVVGARELSAILDATPAVSLALRDAEVFDQGWKACQQLAQDQEPFRQVHCDNPYRAAAIREEAAR